MGRDLYYVFNFRLADKPGADTDHSDEPARFERRSRSSARKYDGTLTTIIIPTGFPPGM
jgi:hypothetical protein